MIRDHLATDIIVEISFSLIGGISGECEVIARLILARKFATRDGLYHEVYANGVRYPRVSLSLIARQPLIKRQSARLPPQVNTGTYIYIHVRTYLVHLYNLRRERSFCIFPVIANSGVSSFHLPRSKR